MAILAYVVIALLITAASVFGAEPRDGADGRCPNCGLGLGGEHHAH